MTTFIICVSLYHCRPIFYEQGCLPIPVHRQTSWLTVTNRITPTGTDWLPHPQSHTPWILHPVSFIQLNMQSCKSPLWQSKLKYLYVPTNMPLDPPKHLWIWATVTNLNNKFCLKNKNKQWVHNIPCRLKCINYIVLFVQEMSLVVERKHINWLWLIREIREHCWPFAHQNSWLPVLARSSWIHVVDMQGLLFMPFSQESIMRVCTSKD